MSGEWLPRESAEHLCEFPDIRFSTTAKPGDRWRCECGKIYMVVCSAQHGESWLQFRRLT
jgi:hypothetical protein